MLWFCTENGPRGGLEGWSDMSDNEEPIPRATESEYRAVEQRTRALVRMHGLDDQPAETLAWRERGWSEEGIARTMGSTRGTVQKHLTELEERFGPSTAMTKLPEERGRLDNNRQNIPLIEKW